VTQRQQPPIRRVNNVTSNLIEVVILINNKVTVKAAFNSGKCKCLLNLVEILQLLGDFVPQTPTGASSLYPTGRLPSSIPSKSASPHWFTAEIPPCLCDGDLDLLLGLRSRKIFHRFHTLVLELKVVPTQGDLVPYLPIGKLYIWATVS